MSQPNGPRPTGIDFGWDWRALSECRSAPYGLFHQEGRETKEAKSRRVEAAKSYCRRCSVLEECRAYNDSIGDTWSIYADRTPEERGFRPSTGCRLPISAEG
jgi:WhiB family redox-sensing transcriptional regulator